MTGVSLSMTAEANSIGLSYQSTALFGWLSGTEPLVVDLCDACGTVARMYVREPGKKWNRQS